MLNMSSVCRHSVIDVNLNCRPVLSFVASQEESWFTCRLTSGWTSFWIVACHWQLEVVGSIAAVAVAAVEVVVEEQEWAEAALVLQEKQGVEEVQEGEPWARPAWNPRGAVLWRGPLPWSQPPWKCPHPGRCSSGSQELPPPSPTGMSGKGERPGVRSGQRPHPRETWPKHRLPSSAPPRSHCWTPGDTWNKATTPMPSLTLWYNTGTHSGLLQTTGLLDTLLDEGWRTDDTQDGKFPTTEIVVYRAVSDMRLKWMLFFESVFLSLFSYFPLALFSVAFTLFSLSHLFGWILSHSFYFLLEYSFILKWQHMRIAKMIYLKIEKEKK